MGAGQSKDELLYQEVQNGNHDAVKALRRSGASLEWIDKEGRSPLILACTRGELLDMAITLLNLGANIDVYRPGTHRGTPLHHAAKRGLEKTVTLLLSRGANPMVINDAGLTPLQMARSRGHVSVVRILEEHLCLFSGMIREISGLGILETIAPNLVTKKVWVVVLPIESVSSRRPPTFELAVYQSIKVPQPRTVIILSKAEIEEPKFNIPDPVLYITDKTNKTKYKFLSENEGDKARLEKLYKACKGIPQTSSANGSFANPSGGRQDTSTAPLRQPVLQSLSADASRPANQSGEGSPESFSGWGAQDEGLKGWGPSTSGGKSTEKQTSKTSGGKSTEKQTSKTKGGEGWDAEPSSYSGWGPGEAGPSAVHSSPVNQPAVEASYARPSAPPLPEDSFDYPSLNESANAAHATDTNIATDEKSAGTCVICWDAPAEGACVPCGHLAGCMECLSEVKAKNWGCPVCRVQIQQIVKVYAV
ncbi:hypothetical protein GOP47_0022836 [Adiantum capillus-veneris]|uniref:RING-type domain-containing protein n=1 Tax=Adiantum capillus-veneris TaxID=13818 RepID=A0A9D4U6K5_ADICA|nr:hypothetical protein GOP47_0022836 [Adiantum capillus-veneris]